MSFSSNDSNLVDADADVFLSISSDDNTSITALVSAVQHVEQNAGFFKPTSTGHKICLALSPIALIASVLALILFVMPPVIFGLLIAATVASALLMMASAYQLTHP